MDFKLTEKKAQDGDADAQCSLATFYELGVEKPQSLETAAQWWRKAAKQNHPWAIKTLISYIENNAIETSGEDCLVTLKNQLESLQATTELQSKNDHAKTTDGHTILILEDEPVIRSIFKQTLTDAGITVIEAETAEIALEQLRNNKVSITTVDLNLPGMNGLEFIKEAKKEFGSDSKYVVCTAYSDKERIDAGRAMGVDAWLLKPMDPDKFLACINHLLRK